MAVVSLEPVGEARKARLERRGGGEADGFRDNPSTLVGASPTTLRAVGLPEAAVRWLASPDRRRLAADRDWLAASRAQLLCVGDDRFPAALTTIPDAPLCLYVQGDPLLLGAPQLAMVGARSPTQPGVRHAQRFARSFCAAGLVITSGLAIGIDQACHETALQHGRTVAVLGSGLDHVYPQHNAGLAARIVAAGGALLSEFPPGVAPLPQHFPRRNRLISGLARALVVIEAASRSGTLITARLAADQGRTVFVLPGAIHNPMAAGCHLLIRQGATLVTSPEQVLDELQIPYEKQELNIRKRSAGLRRRLDNPGEILLDALGYEPSSTELLAAATGLAPGELAAELLRLELDGKVVRQSGGRFMRLQT
jgi:DNA processing protein